MAYFMNLFDRLPDHLHLARNSNAPEFDRWRLYSSTTNEYIESSGAASAEECMQKYVEWEDNEKEKWRNIV